MAVFRPNCGFDLKQPQPKENEGKIGIANTKGDVMAPWLSGQNNIIAKDIAGNINYFHIENITLNS